MRLVLVSLLVLCSACAPNRIRMEVDHTSHPFVGAPFSPKTDEDSITQAQVLAEWEIGGTYIAAGIGKNLRGKNGGGFYGPDLMGTVRVGRVWEIK